MIRFVGLICSAYAGISLKLRMPASLKGSNSNEVENMPNATLPVSECPPRAQMSERQGCGAIIVTEDKRSFFTISKPRTPSIVLILHMYTLQPVEAVADVEVWVLLSIEHKIWLPFKAGYLANFKSMIGAS